jgi:hypothetical protein
MLAISREGPRFSEAIREIPRVVWCNWSPVNIVTNDVASRLFPLDEAVVMVLAGARIEADVLAVAASTRPCPARLTARTMFDTGWPLPT